MQEGVNAWSQEQPPAPTLSQQIIVDPYNFRGHPGLECHCRGPTGHMHELEERLCLRGPEGNRIATCVMNQNVTSWQFSGEACVTSDIPARSRITATLALLAQPAP